MNISITATAAAAGITMNMAKLAPADMNTTAMTTAAPAGMSIITILKMRQHRSCTA